MAQFVRIPAKKQAFCENNEFCYDILDESVYYKGAAWEMIYIIIDKKAYRSKEAYKYYLTKTKYPSGIRHLRGEMSENLLSSIIAVLLKHGITIATPEEEAAYFFTY